MSLNQLTAGELIAAMEPMLSEADGGGLQVLRGVPQLAAWEDPLVRASRALKAANLTVNTAPAQTFPKGEGTRRDRRAEAALRTLDTALENTINVAIAKADEPAEQAAVALRALVFDQGLSFTKTSYLNQTGQTTRLLERARQPDTAAALAQLQVNDLSLGDLLALIESTNAALHEYATAAPATNTAHASERTLLQARRDAIQALTVFLGTADLFLPHTGAQDDPRQRLTGALERAIQLAQRRA